MFPTLLSLGPVVVSSYGIMLVLAFVLGSFIIWKKGREEHFEEEDLFDLTLVSVFWGLVAARLWYVVLHFNDFGLDPVKIFALTKLPGLSFFGSLLGAVLAVIWFCRIKKWDFFEIADVVVLGIAMAQVFGYVGAFLNGSGYGTRMNLFWAVTFPGVEGARHPIQLYAAVMLVMAYWLLAKVFAEYRTYQWYLGEATEARPGLTFFSYLLFLGLTGLVVFALKPAEYYWRGLGYEWWVSLGLVFFGVVGAYWRSGRKLGEDLKVLMGKLKKTGGVVGARVTEVKTTGVKRRRKKRRREVTAGMDVK